MTTDLPADVRRRLRIQQLVTFVIVAIFCVLTAFWQSSQTAGLRRAQHAAYGNCQALERVVQQGVSNIKASTTISEPQRAQALATYVTLLRDLDCQGLKP